MVPTMSPDFWRHPNASALIKSAPPGRTPTFSSRVCFFGFASKKGSKTELFCAAGHQVVLLTGGRLLFRSSGDCNNLTRTATKDDIIVAIVL
jgi:hypothetical protein